MLDRIRVQPDGDVVDEDPAVDVAEVDDPLASVDEGVEGTDDVVPVHPEVQCEVVPRSCRDAGIWQSVFGCDGGHQGLRAVAAGHGKAVRAVADAAACERTQVVAVPQLDRSDSTA